jgi:type I restriction enzyme, S subunit
MNLRPYPRYKPSGIDWLGDVPAHWRIHRLRDTAQLINGYPFDSELFGTDDGLPLVRIRDIYSRGTEVTWTGDPAKEAEIDNGDILIGMDGDFNVAWWRGGPALLNQRVCCLRAKDGVLRQRFLYYSLPYPLKALNDVTYWTTVKHLSSLDVLRFRFYLPSAEEQLVIEGFLDVETAKIDDLIGR